MKSIFTNAFLGVAIAFFFLMGSAFARPPLTLSDLPSPPQADDLKTELPECKITEGDKLLLLRRCRSDLEAFRSGVLEVYNQKIQRYIAQLKKVDASLQVQHASRTISPDEYEKLHDKISDALDSASAGGALMDPYYKYRDKYIELSKWVIPEIGIEERRRQQLA